MIAKNNDFLCWLPTSYVKLHNSSGKSEQQRKKEKFKNGGGAGIDNG